MKENPYIGVGLALVKVEEQFRAGDTGTVFNYEWVGSEEACRSTADALRGLGFDSTLSQEDGNWRLVGFITDQSVILGGSENVETTWELDQNFSEIDFFHIGKIHDALTTEQIEAVKKELDKGEDGKETVFTGAAAEIQKQAYRLKRQGVESVYQARPVLRRTFTYSSRYAQRSVIDLSPNRYTTAQLVSLFNVPAVVAAQLPADPALKPQDTTFGWIVQRSTATTGLRSQTINEVTEWVFAAWADALYDSV